MKKRMLALLLFASILGTGASALSGCAGDSNSESSSQEGTLAITEPAAETTIANTTQATTQAATKATTQPSTQATTQAPSTKVEPTTKAKETQPNKNDRSSSSSASSSNKNNNSSASTQTKPQSKPQQSSHSEATKPANNTASFSSSDLLFNYNGKSVALNENMSNVLSKLGSASNVVSAPSCHGNGDDKTYSYNGFDVYTYPKNGADYVIEINITSSSVPTSKGIKVGDSESKLISIYGSNYSTMGSFIVYSDGSSKSLQFFMDNGVISEIDYYYDGV